MKTAETLTEKIKEMDKSLKELKSDIYFNCIFAGSVSGLISAFLYYLLFDSAL